MKVLVQEWYYDDAETHCFEMNGEWEWVGKFLKILEKVKGNYFNFIAKGDFEVSADISVEDPLNFLSGLLRKETTRQQAEDEWESHQEFLKEMRNKSVSFSGGLDPRSYLSKKEFVDYHEQEMIPIRKNNKLIREFIEEYKRA